MEPVSYTHLDVYKRQVYNTAANYKRVLQYDPLLKGAIRKNLLTERIDIVTVSYTHLLYLLIFCIGQIFENVLYFLLVLSAIQEVRFHTSSACLLYTSWQVKL